MNPYEVLGVPYDATIEEIKDRFRSLSKKYHPDISKEPTVDYVEIIDSYKILADSRKRDEFDLLHRKEILKKKLLKENLESNLFILPVNRIEYTFSLGNILKEGIRIGKSYKHNDLIDHMGQDIVISVRPFEVKIGAVAILELPVKLPCPVCRGSNTTCYRCKGSGFIKTIEKINFLIPQSVKDSEVIEFNPGDYYALYSNQKNNMIYFKSRSIRLRIVFIE